MANVTHDALGIISKELDSHKEESYRVIDSLTRALMALDARIDTLETEIDLLVRRLQAAAQATRKDEEGKEL